MSNAFNNYLSKVGTTDVVLKDYQHAKKLYVDNNYLKSPKFGFLYYVLFNINQNAILDQGWGFRNSKDVGLLVKKIDLPKFTIANETLNQYNRKTVVQTKLTYNPISIEFHDDNQDISNNLWINYYQFYYKDSNYGGSNLGEAARNQRPVEYQNTKFDENNYSYGRYNYNDVQDSFFTSIDIYVLHQQQFTQFTLVNPKITEWAHDSLDQSQGNKVLQNKMTLMYENVFYNQGIVQHDSPEGFATIYYDNQPSPLATAGNPRNQPVYAPREASPFDKPGKDRVFGNTRQPKKSNTILDIAKILVQNQINKKGLGKLGPVGYNIAGGILGALGNAGQGKSATTPAGQDQPGVFKLPGGVGINVFKALNTSVDGKVRANPAAIILPKIGGRGG